MTSNITKTENDLKIDFLSFFLFTWSVSKFANCLSSRCNLLRLCFMLPLSTLFHLA